MLVEDREVGKLAELLGVVKTIPHHELRPLVRSPYRFSRSSCYVRAPAPRRGEHNAEVLRELLGLEDERIRELEASGVLSASRPDES